MKSWRTFSILSPGRTRLALWVLLALVLLAAGLSLCLGSVPLSPALVPEALAVRLP